MDFPAASIMIYSEAGFGYTEKLLDAVSEIPVSVISAKAQFSRGDTVTWHNSRAGIQMSGTIAKINQKSIDVRTAQGLWRVSANLLKRG